MVENENLSHVGMSQCFICGECKEILLDRRLKKTLPQMAVYNKEPCDKCKKIMEDGCFFIGARDGESGDNPYRTGHLIALKDSAIKRMKLDEYLEKQILKQRVCFVELNVLKKIGLIKDDGEIKFKKEFEHGL